MGKLQLEKVTSYGSSGVNERLEEIRKKNKLIKYFEGIISKQQWSPARKLSYMIAAVKESYPNANCKKINLFAFQIHQKDLYRDTPLTGTSLNYLSAKVMFGMENLPFMDSPLQFKATIFTWRKASESGFLCFPGKPGEVSQAVAQINGIAKSYLILAKSKHKLNGYLEIKKPLLDKLIKETSFKVSLRANKPISYNQGYTVSSITCSLKGGDFIDNYFMLDEDQIKIKSVFDETLKQFVVKEYK